MKIFVDTNLIVDYLEKRQDFYEDAIEVLRLSVRDNVEIMVSDLTIVNVRYITRKTISSTAFCDIIKTMRKFISITSMGQSVVDEALTLAYGNRDFEDVMQYCSAISYGANCIVTRNIKDYGFSKIPVYTPKELLSLMKN